MTTNDLKIRIKEELENVPEDRLQEILVYLQEIQKVKSAEELNAELMQKILAEDRELLKKLAQ